MSIVLSQPGAGPNRVATHDLFGLDLESSGPLSAEKRASSDAGEACIFSSSRR